MKLSLLSSLVSISILASSSQGIRAQGDEPHGEKQQSVLVETAPAAKRLIARRIVVYGRVQVDPSNQRSIVAPREGTADRIMVRVGQRISKGASIVELITAPTARMQFDQAKTQLDFARKDLVRLQRLMAQRLATNDQVAAADNAVKQAESAFVTQKQLGTGQERETIAAPYDGIVVKLLVAPGEHLTAGAAVAIIAEGKALLVTLGLEPEEAGAVQPGMRVDIHSPFLPALAIKGTVDQVHAMTDPTTRLVDAVIRFDEADTKDLALGMTIEGSIVLKEVNSITVPRRAVLHDDKGDYLFIVSDATAHRVAVTTGAAQDDAVAIEGQIKDGDLVVVTGNYELQDGMKTRNQP